MRFAVVVVFEQLQLECGFQARAKLPKKRRRVLPVEPTRGPRLPGQTPTGPAAGAPAGGPASAANRRMNAVKTNHPKDFAGPIPKLGKKSLVEGWGSSEKDGDGIRRRQ